MIRGCMRATPQFSVSTGECHDPKNNVSPQKVRRDLSAEIFQSKLNARSFALIDETIRHQSWAKHAARAVAMLAAPPGECRRAREVFPPQSNASKRFAFDGAGSRRALIHDVWRRGATLPGRAAFTEHGRVELTGRCHLSRAFVIRSAQCGQFICLRVLFFLWLFGPERGQRRTAIRTEFAAKKTGWGGRGFMELLMRHRGLLASDTERV